MNGCVIELFDCWLISFSAAMQHNEGSLEEKMSFVPSFVI